MSSSNRTPIIHRGSAHWKHGSHKGAALISLHLNKQDVNKKPKMYDSVQELFSNEIKGKRK